MKFKTIVLALLLLLGSQQKTYSQTLQRLKVAHIFSNNMVLQRNVSSPIWGWAKADTKVSIQLAGTTTIANTNAAGKWLAYLPAQNVGTSLFLKIYQPNDTITINNVAVGDVWLAAGQSNMGWRLDWGVLNKDEAIKNATNPNIRFFTVTDDLNNKPQPDVSGGEWLQSNPQTAPEFSALAYFFAKNLQQQLQIPVGIIHSSWGGTKIEAWMSAQMLKTHPEFTAAMATQIADTTNFDNGYEDFNATNKLRDSVLKYSENGINQKVFAPNYDDTTWQTILLPAKLTSVGVNNFYGYCWFRKTVNIPLRETKKDFILNLGEISNENICYVNGQKLERLNQNPIIQYTVPYSILKPGNNQITIRVLARYGVGGFDSKANDLFAQSNNKKFKIRLAGNWKFNQNIEPQTPLWAEPYNKPSYIYNAKIAPLLPYALKGIIWYQGESNDKNAQLYQSLFPILINNWRSQFNQAKLPFIYGQLANYGAKATMPVEQSNTAIIRDAQLQALKLPNTAMVVNIDLGLDEDVHFKNKQACGQRFALAAMDIAYKNDKSFITPVFKSAKAEGNSIRLFFSDNTTGFKSKNNQPLKGFVIRAAKGKFVWAKAKIQGKQITVWANGIAKPTAVRYAWANNPTCNLLTLDGLPVSPFKTD